MVTANPLLIPELRVMLAEGDVEGLRGVAEELHPASVAEFSEGLEDRELWQLLDALPLERQGDIFPYYPLSRQIDLVKAADRQHLGPLLESMAADNRVELLRELDSDLVEAILPLVAKAERHDIRMLLSCPENSAGALMTTEYASLPADITAGEAVARLRSQAPDSESIYYIYVLDADRHLVGFISLRDLILARPNALVGDLMQEDPISVRIEEPRDEVVQKLAVTRMRLTDSRERPHGELRITTTVGIGTNWLAPRLGEFLELYPDITVNVILSDDDLDLSMREADMAIRVREPQQPDLIRRRLFTMHFHAYASPAYIKRHGQPRSLDDLDKHRILIYGASAGNYLNNINSLQYTGRDARAPRASALTINNLTAVCNAVGAGVGIAVLPDYLVQTQSELLPILPEADMPELECFLVYPEELKNVARVQVFRDFLVSNAQRWDF
jgi:DNA-binding transcriptional LysR family regulator